MAMLDILLESIIQIKLKLYIIEKFIWIKSCGQVNTLPGVVVLGFAGIEGVAWMSNTIPPITTGSASSCFNRPLLDNSTLQ